MQTYIFSNIDEFYRKLQFNYYFELNNKYKYPKKENEFEKSKDYKKLIKDIIESYNGGTEIQEPVSMDVTEERAQ